MMDAKLKIATTALSKITTVPRAEFDMTTVATIAQTALRDIDAIAPPVAAGSVDNYSELTKLIFDRYPRIKGAFCASIAIGLEDWHNAKMTAWGAQQREQGNVEQAAFLKECMVRGQAEFNRKWTEQKERAEKAEARVAELEAQLADAKPYDLKA